MRDNYEKCHAQSLIFKAYPKYEVRAVWLTTLGGLDWPHGYAGDSSSTNRQKEEFSCILDKLQEANVNTILLQTRIRGTVIYPSEIEPWDGCFSGIPGKSPGYDPLAFAVEECHKRGMEIHAWIVTIPTGKWNALGCKNIRNKYPQMIVKDGNDGYINPGNISAAPYLAGICKEITEKYDIDGIHLDYIRYPETWKLNVTGDMARENITAIVRQIHKTVKACKPWVKISCSSIGKYDNLSRYSSRGWNAYTKGLQDTRTWLKSGFIDQLYPMMYFRGNNFYPFAFDWKENSYGRSIIPGLGIYFMSPTESDWPLEEIKRQMYVLRANNMGYAFFRNKFFCNNVKNIYSFTKSEFNLYPALIPPMTWQNMEKPKAPEYIKTERTGDSEIIHWGKTMDEKQGGIMYNVYASKEYPVDINDIRNALILRQRGNTLTLIQGEKLFYAVTAIDRYGNESEGTQQDTYNIHDINTNKFLKNDGQKMFLPEKDKASDAEYILIESLTGSIIATYPYKDEDVDISNMKNGLYRVYSLNRKNIAHRLGFLCIKR